MKYAAIRTVLGMIAAVALSAAVGCQTDISPSPGMGDPVPAPVNDPVITILAPELRPWLGFHPAIIVNDGHKPMSVETPMRNMTVNRYFVDYRFLFYNAAGQELTPAMGWQMVALEPKQLVRLKGKALSTEADSYRLEIKWAK
jgi:hypothetical protein